MKQGIYIITVLFALSFSACHNSNSSKGNVAENVDTTTLHALLDSTNALFESSKYEQSLDLAKTALEMSIGLEDTAGISESLSCMLCDYQQLGMQDSAIIIATRLIDFDKTRGNAAALASDYSNLAYIYTVCNKFTIGAEFIEKSIEYEKTVEGQPKLGIRYGIAAEIYNQLSKDSTRTDSMAMREKALDYICSAYDFDIAHKDTLRASRRLSVKGDVLSSLNKATEAEQAYKQAIIIQERYGERHSLAITNRQLGCLYLNNKKVKEAIPYLEKAKDIARSENELYTLEKDYKMLSVAYKAIDEKKSNEYLRLYSETKDSVYTLESASKLSEYQAKYNIDKEKENAQKKQHQFIATLVIAALVLVIVIVFVIVVVLRHHRRVNILHEQIRQLKQQMSEQQQQFLEQINKEEEAEAPEMDEKDKAFIESVNKAIFDLMGRSEISAESIASTLCITSQQLRRRIKAIKDTTAVAYINNVRMSYAKQLLQERPDLSIVQVGQLCGFYEATNFTRSFKKEYGQTPSQFREDL